MPKELERHLVVEVIPAQTLAPALSGDEPGRFPLDEGVIAEYGDWDLISHTFDVRWYYLLGGVLGAAYVFTALVVVDEIGAGGVAAATITGQLTLSIVLDRLCVLGLAETPLTWERALGVALLLAGTYLIVR